MSDLWICREQTAKKPFYLEVPGIEIWTIEELCFYLYQSKDSLEDGVIGEELFMWLTEELKLPRLAGVLVQEKRQGKSDCWCAWFLLKEIGMYSGAELEEFRALCFALEDKDEFERQKLKADRLLRGQKYVRSIEAYQRLLEMDEIHPQKKILLGDIWHNLGVAHAKLFLFAQAQEYFEKAYRLNHRPESLEAGQHAKEMQEPGGYAPQVPDFGVATQSEAEWGDRLHRLLEEYKKKVT